MKDERPKSNTDCVNCKKDCPQPTRWQHYMDAYNLCQACGCDDYEPEVTA